MKLKKIGKGAFTTAYKRNDGKVLLQSVDPIKECMAHGWFPQSRLFPKLQFGKNHNEYIMRYYPRHRSLKKALKPEHYEFYKELVAIYNRLAVRWGMQYDDIMEEFKKIKCRLKRRHMIDALEACRNYGNDVVFEISPRNVAVSDTGGLVLLDCFFLRSKLKEVRSRL